jgi:hypothetical protein
MTSTSAGSPVQPGIGASGSGALVDVVASPSSEPLLLDPVVSAGSSPAPDPKPSSISSR